MSIQWMLHQCHPLHQLVQWVGVPPLLPAGLPTLPSTHACTCGGMETQRQKLRGSEAQGHEH
jgi:hypothetical protein